MEFREEANGRSGDESGVRTGFSLPGMWTAIDPTTIDIWMESGELTFPVNALGLFFNEVDVVYNGDGARYRRQCRSRAHRS